MKILLVNLPWIIKGRTGVRAGSRWPHVKNETERDYMPFPFFLAYSFSILKENDFDVYIIDAIASEMNEKIFLNKVKNIAPDVLVAETSAPSRQNDLDILKQINKNIKIIICGPDYAVVNDKSFIEKNNFIDAVLRGEYEQSLLKFLQYLRGDKKSSKKIGGLIYREKEKINDCSKEKIELSDLDKIPWPHRESLPLKKYIDAPGGLPLPCAQMWASRGCPFQCKFCAWPQLMFEPGSYRVRNPDDVLDEMEYLVENFNYKSIYFDDDTFNIDIKKTTLFLEKLSERRKKGKIKIPWAIMARADLMTEELLIKFKEAGLYSIKYGVESASQKVLNSSLKQMNLEKTVRMIKFTKKLGIKVHLTFVFGLPDDTKENIDKTIDLALSIDPDSLQFSIASPFPGTALFNEMEKGGLLITIEDDRLGGDNNIFIKNEYLSPYDLLKARSSAYEKWGKYLEKKRNPSLLMINKWHLQRARQYLKIYGFKSLFFKVVDYSLFFINHNYNIYRHVDKTLVNKNIRITQGEGSVKIFYNETEITNGAGINCSFILNNKRYSSSLCALKYRKIQPNQGYFLYNFKEHDLDIKILWSFFIMPEKIIWEADLINNQKIEELKNLKFSLILNHKYNTWFNSKQVELFPDIEDWKNIKIRYKGDKVLGVYNNELSLPAVKFDFITNGSSFEEELQNTCRLENSRMISAVKNKHFIKASREKLFSAAISFEDK